MSIFNVGLDKLEAFGKGLLTFGRKNASTLLSGGGIVLGWVGVYVFWTESKKAEEKIRAEEEKLNENLPDDATPEMRQKLSRKEKLIIYATYCWPSALCGAGSTFMNLYSHKIDSDDIAKAYMVAQFFKDKSNEQQKTIDKMKEEIPDKKIHDLENDIIEEKYPREEIMDELIEMRDRGGGGTLFIDCVTHCKFRADILDVTNGIADVNDLLRKRRDAAVNKKTKRNLSKAISDKIKDPFFASDNPHKDLIDVDDVFDEMDSYPEIYSSVGLDVFLKAIGETDDDNETRLDEILEFRFYGGGDLLKPKDILKYKKYADPETGIPTVCFIDYTEFLSPTTELMERNPL